MITKLIFCFLIFISLISILVAWLTIEIASKKIRELKIKVNTATGWI
jgi:hypothetical protein